MEDSIDNIYRASLKFLYPLSLEKTYRLIVEEAVKLVDGDEGSIILLQKGKLRRVYASNNSLYKTQIRSHGYTYKSYKTRRIIVLSKDTITKAHPEFSDMPVKSDIISPLVSGSKSIGVISVISREKKFTIKDKEALHLFGPLASLAIRKAQLYNELSSAIETRDLFLSLASHELKTPITTIYVYLQLIQRNMKKNKKFDPNWIQTLLDEMIRLTKIVDELLELSRIRTGKLNYSFSEVNIKEVLDRALLNFKATRKNKIILEDNLKDSHARIIGDFDKLIEVIINLLDNAAKHSPANKGVKVTVSYKSGYIIITVQDFGKGIPKSDIKRVFQGFFKSPSNTKPGMGLGLYLSKQIVDKHHGKIMVKSKIDEGTTFTVLLPKLRS